MAQKLSLADSGRRKWVVLLELVTSNDDSINKELIITEIFNRLKEKFFERISKIGNTRFSGIPDVETKIKDVFQDTFEIAFKKIGKFKWENSWSDKECEKKILNWLSKIANHLLLTECKACKKEKETLDEYDKMMKIENSDGAIGKRDYTPSYDKGKFDEVYKNLSPMAKDVLLACLKYDTISSEKNTNHLPDSVIDDLKKKHGVTAGALRKAKERTIKKILACKLEN